MKSKYKKITLGGLAGTGKGTISRMLADKLSFNRVSFGDFARKTAEERGVTLNELDEMSKTDESIDRDRDQYFKEYGEQNENFVAEGRLAAHFIKDAFKILLICDDRRFKRVSERDNISEEEARAETLEREGTYAERYGGLYDLADFNDPKYYDLVIDTSELTPDEILDKIINDIT